MTTADRDRVCLVTGGNRGLGLAIVQSLAARGLRVVLGCRSLADGAEAVRRLGASGARVTAHQLDVADQSSIAALIRWLHSTWGRCDVLVNNAAVAIDDGQEAVDADLRMVRRMLDVNLLGAWELTQAVAPAMRARGYGRIVNVSSGAGSLQTMHRGVPGYRVSKAALNALTIVLADELRADGILVNACCPGWVRTRMGGGSRGVLTPADAADTPVWLATLPPDGPTGGLYRNREPLAW